MAVAIIPAMIFSSCSKEFLERTPTTALETNVVLNDPDMLPSTVVGTMSMISSYGYMGRNAIIAGELMTDMVSTASRGSAGHMEAFERWDIVPDLGDVSPLWANSYAISAAATQTIYSAKRLLADSAGLGLKTDQIRRLQNAIGVSGVMKAFAEFYLTQYFCVDYNLGTGNAGTVPGSRPNTKVGIILIDEKPLSENPSDVANMSTLDASFKSLHRTLEEAIHYFDLSGSTTYTNAQEARFFPTKCAAYVMQARVFLAQHDYQNALTAAQNALDNLPTGTSEELYSTFETLSASYSENVASNEDIWTLNYDAQDNLSANSLQNYFASYGGTITKKIRDLFKTNDIRKNLYPEKPGDKSCCLKYPNANGVFNVPLMRVPELYLIQAEAYAAQGDKANTLNALLKVLEARDTSVKALADIEGAPYNYGSRNTADELIEIVLDERAKELAGEGFRWSDLRRNSAYGIRLNRPGTSGDQNQQFRIYFGNYNLARFALPVPYSETASEQWANGHGLFDNGTQDSENWQNNAWDRKVGNTYTISEDDLLPTNGSGLDDEGNVL